MKLGLRRALLALTFGAVTSRSLPARAEGARILFVAPQASAFSARMRAEIEAMGFTVEPATVLDEQGPPTAIAAARVIEAPPPRRIELWIVDRSSGRLVLRAVLQPYADEDEGTQTVRASEQLRAFLQPLREPAPSLQSPPSPPAPSPPSPPAPLPAPGPRFVTDAAVSVPLQAGGAGVDLALRARWMATGVIGVGVMVSVPIAGSTVSSTEGSASLGALLVGAELSTVFFETRAVRLSVSAGSAVAWLRATGTAATPYVASSGSVVTALPLAGVEVAPRLTDRVRLTLDGHAGVSVPRADIVFAGKTVATWARPLGLLSAGVSVDF